MINTLISYDDQDFSLGEYFHKSLEELKKRINNSNIAPNYLDGALCTLDHIEQRIKEYNSNKFIFVAFSHGRDNCLHTSSDEYVNSTNSSSFKDTLFYSTACHCSTELGPELIANGCYSFVGYSDKVNIHPEYQDDFINCEIHAIVEFLNSDVSIGDAYKSMHRKYDETIIRLLMSDSMADVITASTLAHNQTLLTILGNQNLMASDLHSD
ncbi:hypothetical protein [Flavobacterium sp. HJSW_4]|uniref:hypothetical protein n=1 Tax=Flavobacterium sp. HJSW_4 TaxID=3344660 RepID=UPI0035F41731